MTSRYAKNFNTQETPQSEAIPGSDQVPNSAGGFAYKLDCFSQLTRFLILGSMGGTYYIGERNLTKQNMESLQQCIDADSAATLELIRTISKENRAPSRDPALFALAYCAAHIKDKGLRRIALHEGLLDVARIGTDILHFAEYIKAFRGWGRSVRSGIGLWYQSRDPEKLAYQLIKYRQRDGWTHRDVLRKAHPVGPTAAHNALYDWTCRGKVKEDLLSHLPAIIGQATACMATTDAKEAVKLIRAHNLPREVVSTELLNEKKVWEALLEKMPMMAMVRNLGKMSSIGLVSARSAATQKVVATLSDPMVVKESRMHPIGFLYALATYKAGHGFRGKLTWTVNEQVTDALEEAFYASFGNVTPIGNGVRLCLDVSGSMGFPMLGGPLTYAMGTAAMAMVTARSESDYEIVGFCDKLKPLPITNKTRLPEALKIVQRNNFGGTDCALPMVDALKNKEKFETFAVYTDNETWFGNIHPSQALVQYSKKMDIDASLVVVGMAANPFSIADPKNPRMMDVVGFDAATPEMISRFARKEF